MLFKSKQNLNYSCRYANDGLIFSPDDKIKICKKI